MAGSAGRAANILERLALRNPHKIKPWQYRWMPSETMRMINNPTRELDKDVYHFRVAPHMNKFEIKEYLTKLYGMDVKKVHTVNYDGRTIHVGFPKKRIKTRTAAWKKAIVFLKTPPSGRVGMHAKPVADESGAEAAAPESDAEATPGEGPSEK